MSEERQVIPPPAPGLDFRRHYGHHQSPAIRAGGLIFCSGMLPVDAETGERRHGTLTEEAHCIFANLKLLLESADSALDRLVQMHALIYDSIEYDVLNRVYRGYVPDPPPARTVWTARSEAGFKLQLDALAAAAPRPAPAEPPALDRQIARATGSAVANLASGIVRGGPFLFVSGLCAIDLDSGAPQPGTTVSETRLILTNLRRMLAEAGSSMEKVVKVTVLLHSMLEAMPMNDAYAPFFPDPPPARTVCGAALPDGVKVIIECTALA